MSGIYFHVERDEIDDVRVSGSERAYAGNVISNLLIAALDVSRMDASKDPLLGMCGASYLSERKNHAVAYADLLTWLHVAMGDFKYKDKTVSIFDCGLNTAAILGNDAIKLLARLHGQCEIHAYVEEGNRYWLSHIIEQGLTQNILRPNMGWDDVIKLLRDIVETPGPVVTSYSVTDGFPNPDVAGYDIDEDDGLDDTGWYALTQSERWRLAMDGLRQQHWLEMKPENWNTYHFTDGVTGFDIRAEANRLRQEQPE